MTTIDDSNTNESSDTPPYFWFGEISARLRARTRDELHELDLGRRGWRILHTLADGPATADELYASLPHRGRRGGRPFRGRPTGAARPETDARPDGDAPTGEQAHAAAGPREWRGHPDWMRREWERRQQMYRAWMEHDNSRTQDGPHDQDGHDHDGHDHSEHDNYGPDHAGHTHGEDQQGHDHHGDDHQGHDGHDHSDHDHHHEHDDHSHHHPHPDHHGAEQAFERGFERGFTRGVERAHAGHGYGPGGFGYGGFGPGRYGRGFGPGRFGPDAWGHEHAGHGRPPFAGRHGFDGRCSGGVDRILADFVERGWVWFDGDRATLTDEGRAAHDAAAERIRTARATVSAGIDPADLATTLATLEAMARNLGWTPRAEEAEATTTAPDTEESPEVGTDAD